MSEALGSDFVVKMDCKHVYHLKCVLDQIQNQQPKQKEPLSFKHLECPQCSKVFSNNNREIIQVMQPEIVKLANFENAVKNKVSELVMEKELEIEEGADLVEIGKQKLVFFSCDKCK